MELKDQGVIVTGGSRGLGAALGAALAERGARVVLVARDAGRLDETVRRIQARHGEAHGLAADVGDKEAIHRISGAAAALVGDVSLLVHAASTLGPTPLRPLLELACEDLERVLAVNVLGPFRLTKAVVGGMALRGRGTVVAVSSDAAMEAYPGWGAYGATKAATDHLMRTFAAENAGVRFLSFDPGEMDTEMHRAAMPDADPSTLARPHAVAASLLRWLDGSPASGTRARAT
ncbi:MAG: SDR family oxidoreductase [Myxococcales bacterium]|nr:SDR family oxidoreductase [Myxococcales bacterium]